jgi:hypothetical protein
LFLLLLLFLVFSLITSNTFCCYFTIYRYINQPGGSLTTTAAAAAKDVAPTPICGEGPATRRQLPPLFFRSSLVFGFVLPPQLLAPSRQENERKSKQRKSKNEET